MTVLAAVSEYLTDAEARVRATIASELFAARVNYRAATIAKLRETPGPVTDLLISTLITERASDGYPTMDFSDAAKRACIDAHLLGLPVPPIVEGARSPYVSGDPIAKDAHHAAYVAWNVSRSETPYSRTEPAYRAMLARAGSPNTIGRFTVDPNSPELADAVRTARGEKV